MKRAATLVTTKIKKIENYFKYPIETQTLILYHIIKVGNRRKNRFIKILTWIRTEINKTQKQTHQPKLRIMTLQQKRITKKMKIRKM